MSRKKNPTFEDAMQSLGLPYEAKYPGNIIGSLPTTPEHGRMVVAVTRMTDAEPFKMPRYFFGFHPDAEAYRVAERLKSRRAIQTVYVISEAEVI